MIYPKNHPNQTCGYWLITPNQQILRIEANIFKKRAIIKSASGQLQNNFANDAMLVTINRKITGEIIDKKEEFVLCVCRFGESF